MMGTHAGTASRLAAAAGRILAACAASAPFPGVSAAAPAPVALSICERDPSLDEWAAPDAGFARRVMEDVFSRAGLAFRTVPFKPDGMFDAAETEVLAGVFATPSLSRDCLFPLQPIGKMHFGLYVPPESADAMKSIKISDWPGMRVGYSPVSQGRDDDRTGYFERAGLTPEYVEYAKSASAVAALRRGEIDLLFLYTPEGKRPEGLVEIVPIGSRNVYFAVRKDRKELFDTLCAAYRECYIENIDEYDELKEKMLGVPRPAKRVRVAAYERGHLFSVAPDGSKSGVVEDWLDSIKTYSHWDFDYVYGNYKQSLEDVATGRLDLVGGIGFSASRSEMFLYPHTPIGMLRIYLWAKKGSPFKSGAPETWRGMKVGVLDGALSAQRVTGGASVAEEGIEYRKYPTDKELMEAYFSGEVDACVDIEMPALDGERAIQAYASHPMYFCVTPSKRDLFLELEKTLDKVSDNFPKYMKLIAERHYGVRDEMAALTLDEAAWLRRRLEDPAPVAVDFSPWTGSLFDKSGRPAGFAGEFLSELGRRTGLEFVAGPQTGLETAEARFLRGETQFWVPYPAKRDLAPAGGTPVFSLPVPKAYAKTAGADDSGADMEFWAGRNTPEELVSIIRKTVSGIDPMDIQEMFIRDAAERSVDTKIFGMAPEKFKEIAFACVFGLVTFVAVLATVSALLLRVQTKKARAAARRAEEFSKAKSRFLAMMSHELRTPLNAVIGFTEFLSQPGCAAAKQKEYIGGIQTSATALLEFINDILDFSKLESDAMDMRTGECDIYRLMREIPAIFGYVAKNAGIELAVVDESPSPIPVVKLSQLGLRQILVNLVGNSAKFTEKGGIRVTFSWAQETGTLSITVKDTGCGISRAKMDRLFDPFVQDIASRMKRPEGANRGTGLGLPIVKRMVDRAGGTLAVQSEEGKGTVFKIEIPGLETIRKAAPEREETVFRIPESVLVVDDMSINRKVLGIHLANLGVKKIDYAENGADALAKLAANKPEWVLTDMWMPEMDGQKLAEAMKSDPELKSIPVVAVTADIDVANSYSMDLFAKTIAKPVTRDKLKSLFSVSA